jgi:predicted nucleic acid-binding protein
MDRLFLDANVLVSAALKPGSLLAGLWRLDGVRLLGSPYVVAEARSNVPDPAAAARLETLIAALALLPAEPADFELAEDTGLPAKDRPVMLAAIVSKADYLLTGDLTHVGGCLGHTIAGVRIALPGEYLRSR